MAGQSGIAAFHLGSDRIEIDEPGLEQGAGHPFQRLVHAAIQLDLVVQRAKDVGDGALFGEFKGRPPEFGKLLSRNVWERGPGSLQ